MDISLNDVWAFIVKYVSVVLTLSQWHVVFAIVFATSLLTGTIKKMLPISVTTGRKNSNHIYLLSSAIGVVVTFIAKDVAPMEQPLWFWYLMGISSGPISNFLYKQTMPTLWKLIAWKFPNLANRRKEVRK